MRGKRKKDSGMTANQGAWSEVNCGASNQSEKFWSSRFWRRMMAVVNMLRLWCLGDIQATGRVAGRVLV